MENIEKLPKWAQKEIEALERRVEDAERLAQHARLATNPDETDTYIEPDWKNSIGLRSGERINFRVGDEYGEIQARLNVDHRGERYLSIHGTHGGLVIEPQVSNVIRVRLTAR